MKNSQPFSSRNLFHAGNSTTTIVSVDLTLRILSLLPARSLIRFQSVSKLWFSIIRSRYLANSFLKRSKTRPRLLLTFQHFNTGKRFIFSAPEHQNNEESTTVVARHDTTFSEFRYDFKTRPVNGLVCLTRGSSIAICNPTTGQIVKLPDVERRGRDMYAYLGYDPVGDEYKVLCVMMFDGLDGNLEQEHFVCTVTSRHRLKWRKIRKIKRDPYNIIGGDICIDGAIYYGVESTTIARFNVRSEKFNFITGPNEFNAISHTSTLINYQGKLAAIKLAAIKYAFSVLYATKVKMSLWVLEDYGKQEWSSVLTCDIPHEFIDLLDKRRILCKGEIHTNEVMFVPKRLEWSKLFSVCLFDFIRESIRRVEVDGIADSDFIRITWAWSS